MQSPIPMPPRPQAPSRDVQSPIPPAPSSSGSKRRARRASLPNAFDHGGGERFQRHADGVMSGRGSSSSRSRPANEQRRNSISAIPEHEITNDVFGQARIHIQGRNHEGLETVFETFSSPDIQDMQGNTLLHIACQNGNKKALKFLLKSGCSMGAQNRHGQTPLHYLYAYRYTELATYLEGKGADATTRNAYGLMPKQCLEHGLKPVLQPSQKHENGMGGGPHSHVSGALAEMQIAKAVALQKEEENAKLRAQIAAAKRERDAVIERENQANRIGMLRERMSEMGGLRGDHDAAGHGGRSRGRDRDSAKEKQQGVGMGMGMDTREFCFGDVDRAGSSRVSEPASSDPWKINPIIAMARQMVA